MPKRKDRQDHEDQETLNHIYNRAGKVCATKGQKHLREFEDDTGRDQ